MDSWEIIREALLPLARQAQLPQKQAIERPDCLKTHDDSESPHIELKDHEKQPKFGKRKPRQRGGRKVQLRRMVMQHVNPKGLRSNRPRIMMDEVLAKPVKIVVPKKKTTRFIYVEIDIPIDRSTFDIPLTDPRYYKYKNIPETQYSPSYPISSVSPYSPQFIEPAALSDVPYIPTPIDRSKFDIPKTDPRFAKYKGISKSIKRINK